MNIEELFKSFINKKVTVLFNEGNRGDGLIFLGGKALLDKYGLDYREIEFPQEACGETLFIYGCGAFCWPHNHNVERVKFYMNRFEKIYILPSSFDLSCGKVKDFIANLPSKVIVYCRERYSFEQVMSCIPCKENVFLDKDLSFFIDYGKWKKKGRGVLFAFRTDAEAKCPRIIKRCLFILECLTHSFRFIKIKDMSRGSEKEPEILIESISKYDKVYTDRAHVAIAAAMLEKKTYIYPNVYHKVKGIYEYSLSGFPGVKWMGK